PMPPARPSMPRQRPLGPWRRRSSFRVNRQAQGIATRFLIALELEHAATLGLLQQRVERSESVIGFVEAWLPAFERLLHHRAPDFFLLASFGDQRFDRLRDEIDRLLRPFLIGL